MADLWKVGQQELLQAGNRRLVIPEAVRAEVLRGPADDPGIRAGGLGSRGNSKSSISP